MSHCTCRFPHDIGLKITRKQCAGSRKLQKNREDLRNPDERRRKRNDWKKKEKNVR